MLAITPKKRGPYAVAEKRNLFANNGDGTATLIITTPQGDDHTVTLDEEDVERVRALGVWGVSQIQDSDLLEAIHGKGPDRVKLHRFIVGAQPNDFVSAINGNYLDVRACNLGIWQRNKWRAAIRENSTEYLL
jgi:hypothetical protein